MASFVVLMHDDVPTAKSSEKTVLVRDAFSIMALAFPILWLFWHRLWLVGVCAISVFLAVSVFAGQNPNFVWLPILYSFLLSLLVAIEGPAWRMAALRASGYRDRTVIEAENIELAQLKLILGGARDEPKAERGLRQGSKANIDGDLIFNAGGQE